MDTWQLAKSKKLEIARHQHELSLGVLATFKNLQPTFACSREQREAIARQQLRAILIPAGRRGERWPRLFGENPPFEVGYLFDSSAAKYFVISAIEADAFTNWLAENPRCEKQIERAIDATKNAIF